MRSRLNTGVIRCGLFLALWIALMGIGWTDLIVGLFTALAATWASLLLMPPTSQQMKLSQLCLFLPHFLWQSVLSGWDVARRALDPQLPLRTGIIQYPINYPPGFLRNTFASITSLLPGSVPCGESAGALEYHTLDTEQPVAEQLRAEQQALASVLVLKDADE
ncbi:Na+/H+ antiporter subunit E [Deefgea rivuli]|uniref:Na+/H+ antiporter subunit E n=1 Tax=Deefgea rivuli TaxID=400948 RepID=UPI0009FC61DC|nr:Na+/H+ antiporter subunit E [Deefgea rivuli]